MDKNKKEEIKMVSRLQQKRKAKHLSVRKLSLLTGVNRDLIARIEAGEVKELPIEPARALCKFLEFSLDDLISFN